MFPSVGLTFPSSHTVNRIKQMKITDVVGNMSKILFFGNFPTTITFSVDYTYGYKSPQLIIHDLVHTCSVKAKLSQFELYWRIVYTLHILDPIIVYAEDIPLQGVFPISDL